MKLTLLGAGPGNPALLTQEGLQALAASQAVIASPRLLDSLSGGRLPPERIPLTRPDEIAACLAAHPQWERACVAFSGDLGFYSGAAGLRALLNPRWEVEAVCGVSTVQYLAAREGIPWQELHLVSGHGVDCDVLAHVLNFERTFLLTGGSTTPRGVCGCLCAAGLDDTLLTVGQNLSCPDEEIIRGSAGELISREFGPLCALLIHRVRPAFRRPTGAFGIPDCEFIRGEAPMTKSEVRAVVLSKLEVSPGDILYDVGAGTGSVSVELALAARWGRVYAVERRPEALELMARNREKFGVYNLIPVPGHAPGALAGLPPPDGLFVGGSDGRLEDILAAALEQNPRCRVVCTAVTLETLERGRAALEALGLCSIEITQLAVSRSRRTGRSHMLLAQNPVFLLSGRGRA